jgi:hypothetical protein
MLYPSDPNLDHSRSRFIALTGELCNTPNQATPEQDSTETMVVSFVIDDVAFDLVHEVDVDGDAFLVECELGPPPQSDEMLLGLLQANMHLLREEHGSFGLRRDGDEVWVTYATYKSLTEVHATALRETMQTLAHRALIWRTGASF